MSGPMATTGKKRQKSGLILKKKVVASKNASRSVKTEACDRDGLVWSVQRQTGSG